MPAPAEAGTRRTADGELTVGWPDDRAREPVDDVRATLSPTAIALHANRPEGAARYVFHGGIVEIAITGGRARVRLSTRR